MVSSSGTWTGPFGYAGGFGYQEDATGLKLLGHRYYDSSTGRFLTRDPIKDGGNWYTYCSNDPIVNSDPEGEKWLWEWVADTWSRFSTAKDPVDMIRPPAAAIGAGIVMWAIWEVASSIKGSHEPPGGNPKPPRVLPHGVFPDHINERLNGDGQGLHRDTRKAHQREIDNPYDE